LQLRVFLFAVHYETQKAIAKAVLEFQSKLDKYAKTGELDWYAPASSFELNRMFPTAHKEEIELDASAIQLAQNILDKKLVIAACESAINDAEMQLKQMLGDAEKGKVGQIVVSWPMRNFKDAPEKLIPARKAYSVRQSNIVIKELAP
jgi:predicted phage-related endonuclease